MAKSVKTPASSKERKAADTTAKTKGSDGDTGYGSGRNTGPAINHYDEDEDRRYLAEERAERVGKRHAVFDAADEMDNPGLKDNKPMFRGHDQRSDDIPASSSRR